MPHERLPPQRQRRGFTLIEAMITIAVIAILALIALPSFQDRTIRLQVADALTLADLAKQAVAAQYAKTGALAIDNAAAGLPPADRIVNANVSSVTVRGGAIDLRFGNSVNRNLVGKVLTLRPATVEGYPQVPITWVCGSAAAPDQMRINGDNLTNVPAVNLPIACRSAGPASQPG